MKICGAIFDMDGLMFDTERIAKIIIQRVGEELNIDILGGLPDLMGVNVRAAERIYKQYLGNDFDYYAYRARRMELTAEYLKEYGLPKKKGLDEVLQAFHQAQIPMALATSSDRSVAENYLVMAGVRQYFDVLICGDMVEKSKPDPEIFLKAAKLLHTIPQETIVLEDSYNGIRAAAAGGFIGFMIPDLQKPNEEMEKLSTYIFDSLSEVVPYLSKRNEEE